MAIKILQIGQEDWQNHIQMPKGIEWSYSSLSDLETVLENETVELLKKGNATLGAPSVPTLQYQAILITSDIADEASLSLLDDVVDPYAVFFLDGIPLPQASDKGFLRKKMARTLPFDGEKEEIVRYLEKNLFRGQYGAKLKISDIDLHPSFDGKVTHFGYVSLDFDGNFGKDFEPLFTYRYNVPSSTVALEFWQEYTVTGNSEIAIEVTSFVAGSVYDIQETRLISGDELKKPFILNTEEEQYYYSFSILARGQGKISFGPLHYRNSRQGLGQFILGGERFADSRRQEFISYFEPGDMKPPLNVYFSGYRSAEGFEGYFMMKDMKSPFLLIGDPRLEGGSFYGGSSELEDAIEDKIASSLDYLGFSSNDLIFSGLSMGTFGALYYASSFNPAAVIVGKPFASLGNTTKALKLRRPNEFETMADVTLSLTGGTDEEHIELLNQKFWSKFDKSDFPNTDFAIAFMEDDDYDGTATEELIEHLSSKASHIYAKGYPGRHNDNSPAINKWFLKQYSTILADKFGRKTK